METTIKRPVTRNRAYMTIDEENAFLLPFKKRAERGQILEVSEIAQTLNETIGYSVSLYMVYDLLRRHQWRKIMPHSKHPQKASEEDIIASKKISDKYFQLVSFVCGLLGKNFRLMFQDEALLDRISKQKRCLCSNGVRRL